MPFQVHPKVYVGTLGFRQGVLRFFLSCWAQLSSFEREGEEGEQRKGKLDLNWHVFISSVLCPLEYLQFSGWISSRCPLGPCWSRQSSFCAIGRSRRCRGRCEASSTLSAGLCAPWPWASPGSRGQPGDRAARCARCVPGQRGCPAAGGERCRRALPPSLRSQQPGEAPRVSARCWLCHLCPATGTELLLPRGKNRSLSSAPFILLLVEAAAAFCGWRGKASVKSSTTSTPSF